MEKQQMYVIKNKYLAESLSFLGFRYYKYQQEDKTVYQFISTTNFNIALSELIKLKKKLNEMD